MTNLNIKNGFILILFMVFFSCNNDKVGFISNMEYSILPYNKYLGVTDCNQSSLNHNEIKKIEVIIQDELNDILNFNKSRLLERSNTSKKNLENELLFIRQYYSFFNTNKDKIVVIKFMCDPYSKSETWKHNWKIEPIGNVVDGGSCYFEIVVNYTQKQILQSQINSIALQ